jgi:hypothetical protein
MPREAIGLGSYPAERLARGVQLLWVAAVAALLLHVLCSARYGGVYPIFVGAARSWLAGEETYRVYNNQDVYRYSPLITALLSPLGLLPDRLGGVLWRLGNLAVFLGGLAWWTQAVLAERISRAQRIGLFLLILPLALGNFHNGQCNLLVLGLLLAAQAATADGCWNRAAVFSALAGWLKVYPLTAGLLLAAVYPRRLAGRLLVACLAGLVVPFLLQRPEYVAGQYASWLDHLLADDRQVESLAFWYRDVRLLCTVWLTPLPNWLYGLIQVVVGSGFAGICIAARWAGWPSSRLLPLVLALGCCWMTAFGPASESVTYVLVAPSVCWALLQEWSPVGRAVPRLLFTGSYGLLVATQVAVWFPFGRAFHTLGPHPAAIGLFLAGLCAKYAGMVPESLQRGSDWSNPRSRD